MPSDPRARTNTSKASEAEQSPRLCMTSAAPTTRDVGCDNEAWWPRSRNLSADLPALFEALAARPGAPHRTAGSPIARETVARQGIPPGVELV